MVSPSDFREDPSRAIYITGEINEQLLHRLTPEICQVRISGDGPITVYINSRGGSTLYAENIRALLKAPKQNGIVCRIITVATNRADSAAADLLALGDYAIAYPNALIHCHGTRLSADEITREKAENLAAALKETNEDFALRLARRVFSRMAFHFANLRGEFAEYRQAAIDNKSPRKMESDLECFACAIFAKLSSDLEQLPGLAFANQERLTKMADFISAEKIDPEQKRPWAETEAEVLRKLLDYELQNQDLAKWTLTGGGINDLVIDFGSLTDFLYGAHHASLEEQVQGFGPLFLEADAVQEFADRRQNNPMDAKAWLHQRVSPIVEPLWYFVVSLCRLIQQGEFRLSATDAYWLGIVDEVIGQRLPTLRLIAENPNA